MVLKAENKLTESESLLHDVASQKGQATAAVQLLANASALPKTIWCDEAASWGRIATDTLEKAPLDDLAKLPPNAIFMLVQNGCQRQAANLCRRMLDSSKDAEWLNNVSWYLVTAENPTNRDPALAVELAKRAAALNPLGGNYWSTLGTAAYRAGDFKLAIIDLQKAVQLEGGRN